MSPDGVLLITGPTAVGKSALGLALARHAPGEIIVADSMQVYRGMDVGTGKPSPAERAAVPHHLLDLCDPTETFSASAFAARAHALVEEIRRRGRRPILVGGTGLYLRAFLKGRLAGTGGDPAIRARLSREAEALGTQALHDRLRALDPATAVRVHPRDLFRTIRALELLEMTGRPPSEIRPDLWERPRVAVSALLVLNREREELYRLIDERARRMWEGGLLEEVRRLLAAGYGPDLRTLKSLGYRQAVAHLQGRLSEVEALTAMQRATRNYARRQLTWFRREPAALWVTVRGWEWVESLAEKLLGRLAQPQAPPKYRMTNVE
ncbi:MAG: tRNA (adenosine(37)-N6)-dimethylallyltransferase MiaA [candidate division NC10 bacterium]|nr:tRNA (adenosine(37)-N6)-dimethylallyltransferase MiaA [candidate division NC10 bacterium]